MQECKKHQETKTLYGFVLKVNGSQVKCNARTLKHHDFSVAFLVDCVWVFWHRDDPAQWQAEPLC